LPVRSLAQHKSTASIYAVLVVKTQRARSETARERDCERERERVKKKERENPSVVVDTTLAVGHYPWGVRHPDGPL